MSLRFNSRWLFAVAFLLWLAPVLAAQDGLKGALSHANLGMPLGNNLAVADLDGDNLADGAILLSAEPVGASSRIKIELHFTGRPNTEFTFESNGRALTVRAWDIDHDGDNDLVVEDAFTHKPVRVWINEGHGDFHEGNVQDYPSLLLSDGRQLRLPSNQPDGLPLWLPPQRRFDLSVLTVQALGRPPSRSTRLPAAIDLFVQSRKHASQSSRAPPFSA